jgi:hypothetical protein
MAAILSTNDREDHTEILTLFLDRRIVACRIEGTRLVLVFEDGEEVKFQGTSIGLAIS